MKFSIGSVNKHGRLGLLYEIGRLPGVTFDTPLLLVQTRKGSVPHLTHEVLQLAFRDHLPLLTPLSTTVTMQEQVQEFGQGIAEFVGLKENFTSCITHDPGASKPLGFRVRDSEALWTTHGKQLVDPNRFMDIMEAFKPDMYVALSDSDTDANSSKKRLEKSLSRSSSMFQKCLNRHTASKALAESALLAAVGGGYDSGARSRMAREAATYPVLGYAIEGFHRNGPEVDRLELKDLKGAVHVTLDALPADRLRIVPGAWHPCVVLALVSLGCDVFDSSLPYLCTERNSALIFPYHEDMIAQCAAKGSRDYETPLSDLQYKEDFSPILASCSCLTCRQHTRAYIHHLINTKELLASVLLMIHNIHHYQEFFETIRKAIKDGTFEEVERVVATCHSKSTKQIIDSCITR